MTSQSLFEMMVPKIYPLLVQKVHQLCRAVGIGLQQALDHQIAYGDQHSVGLIVAVEPYVPVDQMHVQRVHFAEEH